MPQDIAAHCSASQANFSIIARKFSVRSAYLRPMDDKWFKTQQKRVGVTADVIAAAAGKSRSAVSKILSGQQRMTLEWATAFAKTLQVPVATVLEKAGAATPATVQQLTPGFAESDVAPFVPKGFEDRAPMTLAQAFGAKPGVDVWAVKGREMALAGYMPGDFILVDTFAAERVKAGDAVIAQVYGRSTARTVFRRFAPPVLVAASADADDAAVFVVDGENVVIRGRVVASWRSCLQP